MLWLVPLGASPIIVVVIIVIIVTIGDMVTNPGENTMCAKPFSGAMPWAKGHAPNRTRRTEKVNENVATPRNELEQFFPEKRA